MSAESDLEVYLHQHVPLTRAMGVGVALAGRDRVELTAPLSANLNPHQTFFGGSVASLAILTGWCLLHLRLQDDAPAAHLVIARETTTFHAPITCDVTARATLSTPQDWDSFLDTLARKGKARVIVESTLSCGQATAASLRGEYVALLDA